ncbi:MAG: acyltransferase [Bacteroidota bacterium]|nr:acyltransferase [Bacteroidota bacterium]
MIDNKNIAFFPGLNALRFFAALSVIIGHIELIKFIMGVDNISHFYERLNFGGHGVYFFFVLSGFLITYLLLKEKNHTKSISLKKFYLRRIFRIWPLYYLILILGFFVLTHIHIIDFPYFKRHLESNFYNNLWLYLLILPNVAFSIYPAVPHIGQSWSIGVEEQFYLFWPVLVKKSKQILRLITWSFTLLCIFKVIIFLVSIKYPHTHWILYIKKYVAMSKFESMMIGAWGAYIFYENKKKLLSIIYNQWIFYFSILLFLPLNYYLFNTSLQNGIHIVISFMFLVIILNVSTNKSCRVNLSNKVLDYLGQISYGLYMYHLMIIPFVVFVFKTYFSYNGSGIINNILVYSFSILFSVVISSFSYHFIEKYFLGIKRKFEVH